MPADIPSDLEQEHLGVWGKNNVLPRVRTWLSSITPVGAFRAILILALFQGLLSFLVTPPWWHYDEPGHFEYVWLAAHSPTWPVHGQYDPSMRKELGASLLQYGWYRIRNLEPDLTGSKKIPIGITQVGDQPGYYFLASLPLRLMPNAPILVQYYAARLVSLLLYLLIVLVVWYALGEVLPGDHLLRWMATVFVALLPAFADSMASVNNDVSAVLAACLFLWASLRLVQKGYSMRRLLFLGASLAACYLSKNTAMFALALAPLVLILAFLRGRFALLVWGVVGLALVAGAVLTLDWGSLTGWYQGSASKHPARVQTKSAPLGNYAFAFDDSGKGKSTEILQVVPPDQVKALRGTTVTLGAWMWASQPTQGALMFVKIFRNNGSIAYSLHEPMAVAPAPTFRSVTFSVPEDAVRALVYVKEGRHGVLHNSIFLDGLVLASGKFGSIPPSFEDASAIAGTWDGQQFTNLLRNASAEQGGLQFRKWVGNSKVTGFLRGAHIDPYFVLMTLQDWKGTGWYYASVASVLFRTFWASLAGDKAFLRSTGVSSFLQLLTVAGVIGMPVWLWRRRRNLRWDLIGLLGISLLVPWLLAAIRGTSSFPAKVLLFPWARYAYPAILPTALLLCAGWLAWLELLSVPLKWNVDTRKAIFLSLMLGISIFAFVNAIQVLHPQWWYGWVSLLLLFLFQCAVFYLIMRWQDRSSPQLPPDGTGTA